MSPSASAANQFQLLLDPAKGNEEQTGIPLLAGEPLERLFACSKSCGSSGPFRLFEAGDFLVGVADSDGTTELADTTYRIYQHLFEAARTHQLCRIWNYIPRINQPNAAGLENYRAFSRGRALAFEARFGNHFEASLPAASAVGTDGSRLLIIFAAHKQQSRHYENPLQLPAYQYPPEHGPRPPSFARASLIPLPDGRVHAFISGTASIRGHRTCHPGDAKAQLACTLGNLRALGAHCGLGEALAAGSCEARHLKVYLRHEALLEQVRSTLELELLHPDDQVSYLRSDICRSDLELEIELSLLNASLVQPQPRG